MSLLEEFYSALTSEDPKALSRVHIPRSEVFYVRAHLEEVFETEFSLEYVEQLMVEEGLLRPEEADTLRDPKDV